MATATTYKNQGTAAADQAKTEASTAAGKAAESLTHAGQAVSSAASAVGQKVGETASAVGHRADEAVGSVGKGAQSLADTVRKQGPHEGMLGQATQSVASGLEQAGKYVEDKQLSGMADDVGAMIKSHPIPAVLIGLGVGFLIGRALRD
jgi:phage-related minor tail protein